MLAEGLIRPLAENITYKLWNIEKKAVPNQSETASLNYAVNFP